MASARFQTIIAFDEHLHRCTANIISRKLFQNPPLILLLNHLTNTADERSSDSSRSISFISLCSSFSFPITDRSLRNAGPLVKLLLCYFQFADLTEDSVSDRPFIIIFLTAYCMQVSFTVQYLQVSAFCWSCK